MSPYVDYIQSLTRQLANLTLDLATAKTCEEFRVIGRRLELCREVVITLADKWQASVVEFAATQDESALELCAFHLSDTKPMTCQRCREVILSRADKPVVLKVA